MKLIAVSLALSYWLIAATIQDSIQWSNNYHMARQLAHKENKNIILFISDKNNPYCEYMQEDTFKSKIVTRYINKDYIAVRLDIKEEKIPTGIEFFTVPTVYFLTSKGKDIFPRVIGNIPPRKMEQLLKKIQR